jgi:cation:H+ antiporter
MAYGFLSAGVLLLLLGSEALLRGGIGFSRALGISPLLIGLLVVTASTAMPELAVVLQALMRRAPDIAVGDIVGSNLINMLVVLGLGALIRPLSSPPKVVFRDGGALLAACAALVLIALTGTVTRKFGLFLLAGFAAYLALSFITDWRRSAHLSANESRAECRIGTHSFGMSATFLIFGVIAVFFGARCLIDGGLAIADRFYVPQATAALTIIALGTSVPELVIASVAIARRQTNYAAGYVIASSTFNILFVLGLAALLHPLAVAPVLAHADIPIMAAAAALLLPFLMLSWRLTRPRGAFLVLCYIGYIGFLAWGRGYLTPATIGLH